MALESLSAQLFENEAGLSKMPFVASHGSINANFVLTWWVLGFSAYFKYIV